MKIKTRALSVLVLVMLLNSCKKDSKTCWYLVDSLGYVIPQAICGKTESEMQAEYGNQYGFFRTSDPTYCWKLTKPTYPDAYVRNVPQYVIDRYFPGYAAVTVNCNSFCIWRVLFRHKSKITGLYTPTTVKVETYLNQPIDTCSKLFVGRVVIVSETTDSIHTAEYLEQY